MGSLRPRRVERPTRQLRARNPKYPGGLAEQRRRLEQEGFDVVARGDRMFVRDYEKRLLTWAATQKSR